MRQSYTEVLHYKSFHSGLYSGWSAENIIVIVDSKCKYISDIKMAPSPVEELALIDLER